MKGGGSRIPPHRFEGKCKQSKLIHLIIRGPLNRAHCHGSIVTIEMVTVRKLNLGDRVREVVEDEGVVRERTPTTLRTKLGLKRI